MQHERGARSIAAGLLLLAPATAARGQSPEAAPGAPDTKAECAAAYELSQEKRKAGELILAREQLAICVREACPGFIRNDCSTWLEEVEASLPSVILVARHGDRELADVRVSIDGTPVADQLTGKAIPLDPGAHVFRFELEGSAAIERRVQIREGEKNRTLTVTFPARNSGGDAASSTSPVQEQAEPSSSGPNRRTLSYVLAGVGAAALGSFAFFAVTGKSDETELSERCSPNCPEQDIDAVRTKYLVADISLGVGIASLGVATWLFVSSGKDPGESARRVKPDLRVDVQPARGGAFIGVMRPF